MSDHELKILPCYYNAVLSGDKSFEIRYNDDRGFQKGDTVLLREYDPGLPLGRFTDREMEVEITYVTNYKQQEGFVVLGFKRTIRRE